MKKYTKNRNDVSSDMLYEEAIQLLKEHGKISISLLQRKLCIGYAKASDIFDRMEREGLVKRQGCAGILDDGEAFFVK